MTASSPWTDGMIETRKSMERPRMRTRKRPSCGTRFSAMSSSAMTLMRLMIVEWCSLAIGFMAGWSTPSMRYLITTSLSRVSMWMSEARRLRASKTVESTRRMMGDCVGLDLVDGQDLVAVLVVAEDLDLEGLGGLLQHALRALAALRAPPGSRTACPPRAGCGVCSSRRQLVHHRDVGGVGHHQHQPAVLAPVGQEVVAEHQLDGHRLQDLGVGREGADVHVLEADSARPARAPPPPRRAGGGAGGRRSVLGSAVSSPRRCSAEMASNSGR